jgi:hypothetical protein
MESKSSTRNTSIALGTTVENPPLAVDSCKKLEETSGADVSASCAPGVEDDEVFLELLGSRSLGRPIDIPKAAAAGSASLFSNPDVFTNLIDDSSEL